MPIFAEITPLPPAALVSGGCLALLAIGSAIYLMTQQKKSRTGDEQQSNLDPLTAGARWRWPTAFFLAADGVLMALGLAIDPAQNPRLFVIVWLQVLLLTLLLMGMASFDMFFVRRRALQEKRRLVEQDRAELMRELAQRTAHHRNGNGKAPGN